MNRYFTSTPYGNGKWEKGTHNEEAFTPYIFPFLLHYAEWRGCCLAQ